MFLKTLLSVFSVRPYYIIVLKIIVSGLQGKIVRQELDLEMIPINFGLFRNVRIAIALGWLEPVSLILADFIRRAVTMLLYHMKHQLLLNKMRPLF